MCVVEREIEVYSKCLLKKIIVGCLVPEKIDKVLIFLHGYDGDFTKMKTNLSLELYAKANNILIAIPNMNNGYYIDRGTYSVSGFVGKELVNILQEEFSFGKDTKLVIGGISMGGFGALLIGAKCNEVFETVVSISGAFIADPVTIWKLAGGTPGKAVDWFTETFAPFDTLETSVRRNPLAAVAALDDDTKKPRVILTCGTSDDLYKNNLEAIRCVKENNLKYDFYFVPDGKHDSSCFKQGLEYVLSKL